MRALIFDPFAGISGDMTLGALVDLGLDADWLRGFVEALELPGVRVHVERADRRGIDCARVTFALPREHNHRHLHHVLDIVERAHASATARRRAADAFTRIADAEARIHGTTREKVHFHEVGALDSILDVLCTMAAVDELGFEAFFTRPVATGHGWIDIEHGRFPVPAPATLELLAGLPLTGQDLEGECTTPTGAAILAVLTGGRTEPELITVERTGFGAGTRDPADRPNCLRLIAATVATTERRAITPDFYVVQTDIDDMTPEYVPPAQDALLAAGAVDVTAMAVVMKKGRTGTRIEALVPVAALQKVLGALFRNTSTIGARYWPVLRPALERQEDVINWRGQPIRVKRVQLPDGSQRAKPEFEDVLRAAAALGLPPLEVRDRIERDGVGTTET